MRIGQRKFHSMRIYLFQSYPIGDSSVTLQTQIIELLQLKNELSWTSDKILE